MIDTQSRVVVMEGPCEIHGGSHVCMYHREFPENWAPAEDRAEAIRTLLNLFERNLDSAADPLHREAVERAMDDLRDFLAGLGQNDRE